MRTHALLPVAAVITCAFACGGSGSPQGFPGGDGGGGGSSGGSSGGASSGGSSGSGSSSGGFGSSGSSSGGQTQTLIYANTDSELYSMNPVGNVLVDIGPFSDGSGTTPTITDLAVDGADNVWVNSETAIYGAALPASGTGTVNLTLHTQLPSGSKFYALGFTPAGTLESNESLIAGDSAGNLYYIAPNPSSTPQLLGGFGPSPSGGTWELSGDVVFYTASGGTVGLATIRDCNGTCTKTNDSLAQIDVAAMQSAYSSHTPASSLLKQTFGSGTGFGDLFGIGAWGSSVYAFSRTSGGNPAQLVQVGMSGTGTSLMQFQNIMSGWSGAGVTTKAMISVVQ